jgi:hypothetical protein
MLFKLESHDKGTMTHSGVLEFTAEEGSCYIPFWMMENFLIEEGSLLTVTNVSLPKATFVKLQPQHVGFLEIHNPDCNVDFDAPVGYKEPNWKEKTNGDDVNTSSASGAGSLNLFLNLPKTKCPWRRNNSTGENILCLS